ncbi:MAG: AmmeMemoRadiSam system radical SAM enzyme [Bacteroidales bacterium]
MQEAGYYHKLSENSVRCNLCPHQCIISEGKPGLCRVRSYQNGMLISNNYGKLSAIAVDPVEKKPLYHFYPGENILSIGSVGCNMHCTNCQNQNISQCIGISAEQTNSYTQKELAAMIRNKSIQLLAFTYNEPIVFYEFIYDFATRFQPGGTECVMVTNGYIMQEPLKRLLPYIDAFNVDLKSYSNTFYKKITGATLKPVLQTIETILKSHKLIEITYLVIPGLNDDPKEFRKLAEFLGKIAGRSQVLHLSRYFPGYKMKLPPTPLTILQELREIAREELDFVYIGNTGEEFDTNTYCPGCDKMLISRNYYHTTITGMTGNRCSSCGTEIHGKFRNND